MLLILVWNHDPHLSEAIDGTIPVLARELGQVCMTVDELEIAYASHVLVSFQGHAYRAEPGQRPAPLLIVVELPYDKPEHTLEVRQKLAAALGLAAKRHVGSVQPVEVFIRTFNPQNEATWYG